MSEQMEKTSELKKKHSIWRRYRLTAIIILLCIAAGYVYSAKVWKSESEKASEEIIRQKAALILGKEGKQLTNKYFAKIKIFDLNPTEAYVSKRSYLRLSDIKLLENFINLQELHLDFIIVPSKTSIVMNFLVQRGILKPPAKIFIDLSPLKNLTELEILTLNFSQINDIKPLASLTNLKELDLRYNNILDIEPLCELPNMEKLSIDSYSIKNFDQLKKMNKLKELNIYGSINPDDVIYLKTLLPDLNIKIL